MFFSFFLLSATGWFKIETKEGSLWAGGWGDDDHDDELLHKEQQLLLQVVEALLEAKASLFLPGSGPSASVSQPWRRRLQEQEKEVISVAYTTHSTRST